MSLPTGSGAAGVATPVFTSTAMVNARGIPDGPQPRQEEILAAPHRHKLLQRARAHRRRQGRNCHGVVRVQSVSIADERVALVAQSQKSRVVDPILLNELELLLDVGVQADEIEPTLSRFRRLFETRPIGPAPAQDPVAIGRHWIGAHLVRVDERVAWVGAADVRSERAPVAIRIVSKPEFVVVAVHVRDERRAIGPAADDLRGELSRRRVVGLSVLLRLSMGEVPECAHVLLELIEDEIAAVLAECGVLGDGWSMAWWAGGVWN